MHRDGAVFEPVSFRVAPGDRLAFVGPNGCGKTSLADLVSVISFNFEGSFFRPAFVTVAHACQQPRWTRGSLRKRLADAGIDETRFRSDMAAPGISEPVLERPIESISFGQQKKIDLARSIATPADLLVWDEPLNFIDVDARELIEDAVLRDLPTLVFVEHDATFIDRVSTSRVELVPRPGRFQSVRKSGSAPRRSSGERGGVRSA